MAEEKESVAVLAAGGMAALLASACCLGPLLLVSLGLTGVWIGQLQVLEPFRPYAIAMALMALFFAHRRVFRPEAACNPGDVCAVPRNRMIYKGIFWAVAVLVLIAIAYPYVVPYLF
jgi:mercuric ion transport protein